MHLPSCCLRYSTCSRPLWKDLHSGSSCCWTSYCYPFVCLKKKRNNKKTHHIIMSILLLWKRPDKLGLCNTRTSIQATAENLTLFLSCLYRNKKLIKGKLISDFIQSQNTPNWKGPIRIIWLTSSHVPVTIKFFLTFLNVCAFTLIHTSEYGDRKILAVHSPSMKFHTEESTALPGAAH